MLNVKNVNIVSILWKRMTALFFGLINKLIKLEMLV